MSAHTDPTGPRLPLGQVLGRVIKMPGLPPSARYLRVVVNIPGQFKGRERNVSCPCGSGKKGKKCCGGRKPITHTATIDRGTDPVDGVVLTHEGSVRFVSGDQKVRPQAAWVETSYPGEKGAKVLHRMPVDEGALTFIPDHALRGYDLLLAVDTGTRQVAADRISVAAVVRCNFVPADEQTWIAQYDVAPPMFEFWNAVGNPEVVAWRCVIEGVRRAPTYRRISRVGIVVDSELGALTAYNSRTSAVDGLYLPDNFELIYARDKGHGLANKLLRRCHREGTALLAAITTKAAPPPPIAASTSYTHFRVWTPQDGP